MTASRSLTAYGRESSPVRLGDGSVIAIRPIEPGDRPLLLEHFEHLGAEARYERFLLPVRHLTADQVEFFTHPDHHRHEALFALDESGHPVGIARYIGAPSDPATAEIAAAVTDDWQGRGVGRALVTDLAGRARRQGIRRLTALMLAENHPMRHLLADLGPLQTIGRDGGSIEVAVDLSPAGNHAVESASAPMSKAAPRRKLSP